MRTGLILTITSLFWLLPAFAQEIRLFQSDGAQVANYDELLARLAPGQTLAFPDGEQFVVVEKLGEGHTSQVWRVSQTGGTQEVALRLPLRSGLYRGGPTRYVDFLNETLDGYAPLREQGIPTVRVRGGVRSQYVVTDVVPHRISARRFLHSLEDRSALRRRGITRAMVPEMEEALVRFASTTAPFSKIGDFKADQIVYDTSTRQWILLDWTSHHRPLEAGIDRSYVGVFGDNFTNLELSPRARTLVGRLQGAVTDAILGPVRPEDGVPPARVSPTARPAFAQSCLARLMSLFANPVGAR